MLRFVNYGFEVNKNIIFSDINLSISQGDFVVLFGDSGSGKTTFLRSIKKEVSPKGKVFGSLILDGESDFDSLKIGYISQFTDSQIVTNKVWHELAFGLENLGVPSNKIRLKVAEVLSYFGLSDIFDYDIKSLSGGQQRLVSLASVLIMNPSILLLDEPLSQLDPISKIEFLDILKRVNRELNITVIVVEHDLNELYYMADRFLYMSCGGLKEVSRGGFDDCVRFLPEVERVLDIRNYRKLYKKEREFKSDLLKIKNVYYSIDSKEILKDINLRVRKGEVLSIIGSNGSGKTTLGKVVGGIIKPSYGKVKSNHRGIYLPQDPTLLFNKDTVRGVLEDCVIDVDNLFIRLGINNSLLNRHPFDLSGGERQLIAFLRVVYSDRDYFILDEPTKGMDLNFKRIIKKIIMELSIGLGKTFILISHDMELVSQISDRVLFLFRGEVCSLGTVSQVLSENRFFTTSINRKYRNGILTLEDIEEVDSN